MGEDEFVRHLGRMIASEDPEEQGTSAGKLLVAWREERGHYDQSTTNEGDDDV